MPLYNYNTSPRFGPVLSRNKFVQQHVPNVPRKRPNYGNASVSPPTMNAGMETMNRAPDLPGTSYGNANPPLLPPGMESANMAPNFSPGMESLYGNAPIFNPYGSNDWFQMLMMNDYLPEQNPQMLSGQGTANPWGPWGMPPGYLLGLGK